MGKGDPSELYRGIEERGVLEDVRNPVKQTVQNRIQRLASAGHLENKYKIGCYDLVSDPRNSTDGNLSSEAGICIQEWPTLKKLRLSR